MLNYMAEEDVTASSIRDLLESAFFDVDLLEDTLLRVKLETGISYISFPENTQRMVIIRRIYTNIPKESLAELLEALNKVNNEYIIVRFTTSLDEDEECMISADCTLFYSKGFNPYHLVQGLHKTDGVIRDAMNEYINPIWRKWIRKDLTLGHC